MVVRSSDDEFVDRAGLLNAVSTETLAVVLSHVKFLTGERLTDSFLNEAAERAHAGGAMLIVDTYHSIGGPIQLGELGIHVYLGSSQGSLRIVGKCVRVRSRGAGTESAAHRLGSGIKIPLPSRLGCSRRNTFVIDFSAGRRPSLRCTTPLRIHVYFWRPASIASAQIRAVKRRCGSIIPANAEFSVRSPYEDVRWGAMVILDVWSVPTLLQHS